jgi:predicted transposase YbfD/YdcC
MQNMKEFIAGFEESFNSLEDARQQAKIDYPLIEVLFLSVVAVAGGAGNWEMIEAFGKIQLAVLRQYYPLKNGAPSDDTIRRVFEILDPERLNEALRKYFTQGLDLTGNHVAIDGKSLKGSSHNGSRALHFLNVYASGSGLTLFGKEVDSKTNEITAIPEAIDALDLKGATVTIDAMGCQKAIAQKIIDKEADYIFGLKENHVALYNEVETAFKTNAILFFAMDTATTNEKGHGRIEERRCRVIQDLSKISNAAKWPGLRSVIEMKRRVSIKDKVTESTNYYISSSSGSAEQMMKLIRSHWKIESMHWMLDVVFKEDASSIYKGNIPANMAIVRRFVLNILGNMKGPRQTRPVLIKMIGWSQDYLHSFIQRLMTPNIAFMR